MPLGSEAASTPVTNRRPTNRDANPDAVCPPMWPSVPSGPCPSPAASPATASEGDHAVTIAWSTSSHMLELGWPVSGSAATPCPFGTAAALASSPGRHAVRERRQQPGRVLGGGGLDSGVARLGEDHG